MSTTKIYRIWAAMRRRCEKPNDPNYHRYGARGITVCERWQKFENFYADMGDRPDGKQLDRVNNDGPYSPANCRWTDHATNKMNRGITIRVTHNGETKFLTEWAQELGVKYSVLLYRYKHTGSLLLRKRERGVSGRFISSSS